MTDSRRRQTVCRSVEYGLRLFGVWPGMPFPILFKIIGLSALIAFQLSQYQFVIVNIGKVELAIILDAMSINLAYFLVFIKALTFAFHPRLLNDIITGMAKDWQNCDILNEPTMIKVAGVCRRICNTVICSHMTSVILYTVVTITKFATENQTVSRAYVMEMELPFEVETITVHIAVLVGQFFHLLWTGAMVGVFNSFLIISVLHVCGQIDIMREKLIEITRMNNEPKNNEQNTNESIFRTLLIQHQQIIAFSDNIENLYSNIALVQSISNTMITCFLGFTIVTSIGSPGGMMIVMKCTFFYFVMSLEAFIYCFCGELLSTKSAMIGDSAYESFWYDLSPSQNRDIFILLIRSQRNMQLTIGKVMELSLRQFTSIMKASASYVSVLNAMY